MCACCGTGPGLRRIQWSVGERHALPGHIRVRGLQRLEDVGGHCRLGHVDHLQATDSPESCRYESMTRPQPATELKVAVVGPGLILITYTTERRERHQRKTEFLSMAPVRECMATATPPRDASHSQLIAVLRKRIAHRTRTH